MTIFTIRSQNRPVRLYNNGMWRSHIFWRLFGAYCVLLALSLVFLGWVLISRMESHLLDEIRLDLEAKTIFVNELTASRKADEWQQTMFRLGKDTRTRISLIADDGKVLADSDELPEQMENHLDRPEVQLAKEHGIGVATRFSGTVHQPIMYLARRNDQGAVRFVRVALPLDRVNDEIRWLKSVVWGGAGITLLAGLALSFLIARRLSAPLVELADAARAIAQGRYGQRVSVSSTDEIGTLAVSFNEMSLACADYIQQMDQDRQRLRAIFKSMVEGVLVLDGEQTILFLNDAAGHLLGTTQEAASGTKIWQLFRHRQLGEAVDKILSGDEPYRCELEWPSLDQKVLAVQGARLPGAPLRGAVLVFHDLTQVRRLERIRQDFVANVSHELKTPLAAIQATVETLLDGALQDPTYNVHFLERVRENADRLHRLVQDLLTLGRIESGEEIMNLQPIAVQTLVDTCMSRQADRARAKGLQLMTIAPPEPVFAFADEEALAEIMDNLLDNAIKYTPTGAISVRWVSQGNDAILQVKDTGVGIPEKDLARVFERFYRVDKARSRELGGTGLGLSIVKHLVQTLGGTITATSTVGAGSVFTIRIPAAMAVDEVAT